MRKFFIFSFLLIIVVAFSSCGNKNASPSDNSAGNNQSTETEIFDYTELEEEELFPDDSSGNTSSVYSSSSNNGTMSSSKPVSSQNTSSNATSSVGGKYELPEIPF